MVVELTEEAPTRMQGRRVATYRHSRADKGRSYTFSDFELKFSLLLSLFSLLSSTVWYNTLGQFIKLGRGRFSFGMFPVPAVPHFSSISSVTPWTPLNTWRHQRSKILLTGLTFPHHNIRTTRTHKWVEREEKIEVRSTLLLTVSTR